MGNEERVILVVEDNPDDQVLITRALRKNNVNNEIVVLGDGAAALDYVFARGDHAGRQGAALPQVMLLDLRLPKVDGLQVLRELRANEGTRTLPVVVLTSSDEERDVVESYQFGANSFVRKPVEFAEFIESVRNLGLFWVLLNRPPA